MHKNNWNNTIKRMLKAELVRKGVTREQLSVLLAGIGIKETKASIDNKIGRGTFSATFMIQCLCAIGCKSLTWETENITGNLTVHRERQDSIVHYNEKTGLYYLDISRKNTWGNSHKLKAISLFTGAGGLDIGLEEAGFQTIACVENDINCIATLKHNRPGWKVFESTVKIEKGVQKKRAAGDIKEIEPEELLEFAGLTKGEAALVVGGAPCQPFSNIGKKEGRNDSKNGDLFLEFVRMVKGIQPRAFLFENVAGITQQKHSEVLNYMIDSFSGSGYALSYSILNAANYGVAQKRERFFLIGIKGMSTPAFPIPTHFKDKNNYNSFVKELNPGCKVKYKPWTTVRDVLLSLPEEYYERPDYAVMNISEKVIERMKLIKEGENFKALPLTMRPDCWKNGKHQGQDTFGRLNADQPSVTIRTAAYNPAKGMYIHPFENRGLNTIEMAALQGFPYDWSFRCSGREKITLVSGGRQIGNAVPPPLANAMGLAIRKQLTLCS